MNAHARQLQAAARQYESSCDCCGPAPDPKAADLRADLMACPDFVHEAIAEIDPVALAAARNSGDAIALLRLVNKACEDYADWCVRHTPGDEVSALRWLLGRYARRAA